MEDFLLFVFESVSQVHTVIMNASSLFADFILCQFHTETGEPAEASCKPHFSRIDHYLLGCLSRTQHYILDVLVCDYLCV
jgi:hypothetical protein